MPPRTQPPAPITAAIEQLTRAQEAEHRFSAFDLYRALGGDERWHLRMGRAYCRVDFHPERQISEAGSQQSLRQHQHCFTPVGA